MGDTPHVIVEGTYFKVLLQLAVACHAVAALGYVISLNTFYYHAYTVLGYFPSPDNPDPKELDLYDEYAIWIVQFADLWILGFIPSLVAFVAFILKYKTFKPHFFIWFAGLANLVAIVLLFSGVSAWFLD